MVGWSLVAPGASGGSQRFRAAQTKASTLDQVHSKHCQASQAEPLPGAANNCATKNWFLDELCLWTPTPRKLVDSGIVRGIQLKPLFYSRGGAMMRV